MTKLTSRKRRIIVSILSFSMIAQQSLLPVIASTISGAGGITGDSVINGANGNQIFNLAPQAHNGDVGFRNYNNFNLDKGDIANLIFNYRGQDIEHFVNLVNNQININGIVNSMRDGGFYNGHAVFVSPNGMVIGASGLLNVGSLTVMTPKQEDFNKFTGKMNEYAPILANPGSEEYQNLITTSMGAGDVTINGRVLARNNVNIDAGNVSLSSTGRILTGVKSDQAFTPEDSYVNDPMDNGAPINDYTGLPNRRYNMPNMATDSSYAVAEAL